MDDMISRQVVLDTLREAENHAFNGYYKGLAKAHKIVANLPSVQPEVAKDTNVLINDCINRQAAIDTFLTELTKRERKNLLHTWSTVEVKYFVAEMLERLPSAQPEIIYCKDCKHVGTDATCCLVCNREGMGLKPYHVYHDDFCSYAERKTDERFNQ